MLDVEDLRASYGVSEVLFGMDLRVGAGEVVTLLGRNGMGKTTTVGAICGIVPAVSGSVRFAGDEFIGRPSYRISRAGIALVPEGRHIFPNLTVRENLCVGEAASTSGVTDWTLDRVLAFFPNLRNRLGNMGSQLSGGEQQMLAIGRALMTNPSLLILDEATEGLAPLVREEIWRCLHEIKLSGLSILVIDKNIKKLLRLADRHYILEKGRVMWSGVSAELEADHTILERYLAV